MKKKKSTHPKLYFDVIYKEKNVLLTFISNKFDVYGKRLQTQETMTAQIADTIQRVLEPKGVAVVIDAAHQCMTTRGVHKSETSTVTSRMLGIFRTDERTRSEFMNLISSSKI